MATAMPSEPRRLTVTFTAEASPESATKKRELTNLILTWKRANGANGCGVW
jgi:hypothetical protein